MIEIPARGRVRVTVLSAHTVVRAGLRALLNDRDNIVVVGEASSVGEALSLLKLTRPDVAVLDPDSEDVTLNAIVELTQAAAGRVLVLTADDNPLLHQRAFEFGAVGIVQKTQPVDILVRAIEKVHAGEIWLDRVKIADLLNGILGRRDPEHDKILLLTKREREVIAVVGEGLKNAAVGERLFISEATVRNHLTSILSKLGLSDRFELAVYSFRHGLVEPATREPLPFRNPRPLHRPRVRVRRAGGY